MVVGIEDSMAPASEVAAGTTPVDENSVQVMGNVGSQR